MAFNFNKKKSTMLNSVVNNEFTNELIVTKDNEVKNYTGWDRIISAANGMSRSIYSVNYSHNNILIPVLNVGSDIFDNFYMDYYYTSEVKQICDSITNLNYDKFVKEIKIKQFRKSIISGVTDFVLPTLINKLIGPKLNNSKVGKIIYNLNIPGLVGIASGSAIDTAINKFELKRYLIKDDQLKTTATSYYLGKYKYANGKDSNFTTRNINNTKNKIIGAVYGSIFSETIGCIGMIMDKYKDHDEEEIVESQDI